MSLMSLLAMAAVQTSGTVTVDVPAMTIGPALEKLGQASGQSLLVAPVLQKEVVTFQLTDADMDNVLSQVAKLLDAEWVTEAKGKRLVPSVSAARERAAKIKSERATALKSEVDKLISDFEKQGEFDPSKLNFGGQQFGGGGGAARVQLGGPGGNFGANMGQMPGGRAILRILKQMRIEDLAAVGLGQRVVFSSQVNRMQRPLPSNALRDAQLFVDEQQKLFENRVQDRQNQEPGRPVPPGPPPGQGGATGPVAKVFLIAQSMGRGDSLNLTYIAAQADGQTIGQGNLFLGFNNMMAQVLGTSEPATGTESEKPIELTENAKVAMAAMRNPSRGGPMQFNFGGGGAQVAIAMREGQETAPVPVPKSMLDLISDPVQFEPLALFASEILGKAAEAKGDDLVAVLPDSLIGNMARNASQLRPTSVFELSKARWGLDVIESDGMKAVGPHDPAMAAASRVDRVALKTLANAIRSKGAMRLDDLAKYSLSAPSVGGVDGLDVSTMGALDASASQGVAGIYLSNREALQIWARLSTGQKNILGQGGSVPVNSFGGWAAQGVSNLVYNSMDGPQVQVQQEQASETAVQFAAAEVAGRQLGQQRGPGGPGGRGGRNMLFERTEVLPNGLPGGTVVTLNIDRRQAVKATDTSGATTRVLSARDMAFDKAMSNLPQAPRSPVQWAKYLPMTQVSYTVTFVIAQGVTMSRSLDDFEPDQYATAVSNFDQLPDEFRNQVEEMTLQIAERMANRGNGQGRRTGSRPPTQRPPLGP